MKLFSRLRLIASVSAITIMTMATVSSGFAANSGEDAQGKLPAGDAIHLKRVGADVEKPWQYQLFQNSVDLKPDADYVLTFWARASGSFDFNVSTKISAPPWAFFGLREAVQLTPEWKLYTLKFNAKGAVAGQTRVTFSFIKPEAGDVWIADVRLKTADAAADSKQNLIANPQFNDGLSQWYVDGKQDGVFEAMVEPVTPTAAPEKK